MYSAFPNFVEAAYLHCMSLLGQAAPHGLAMAPQVWWLGIGLSALLAAVVGLPPAWRAMRLDIVNALAGH